VKRKAMKWNFPIPLPTNVQTAVSPSPEQWFVPSANDPAFSDFNLPLLDQEWVMKPARNENETECGLQGWSK
jgi:hypothetical protein